MIKNNIFALSELQNKFCFDGFNPNSLQMYNYQMPNFETGGEQSSPLQNI
jgi:hypothetical protein